MERRGGRLSIDLVYAAPVIGASRAGRRRQPVRIALAVRESGRYVNTNTKVPLEEAASFTPLRDSDGIITPSWTFSPAAGARWPRPRR
jgi:hypothetical protein